MNILIPAAGNGQRFKDAGYLLPKPFIDVNGKMMIQRVMENLPGTHTILFQREHTDAHPALFKSIQANSILIDSPTRGAACTVLLAKNLINNDEELVIANSDQIIDFDFRHFLYKSRARDASILIFKDPSKNSKWSYVEFSYDGLIIGTKEKQAISEYATCGIYYFKRGRDFVVAAEKMIKANDRTNNEFYVCPSFNYFEGLIEPYVISQNYMHGLGTPEDLERYLKCF